jgi:hypothetical protein
MQRRRTPDEPDCTRLVILLISAVSNFESHTALASTRAGLMSRGFETKAQELARFSHLGMYRIGRRYGALKSGHVD